MTSNTALRRAGIVLSLAVAISCTQALVPADTRTPAGAREARFFEGTVSEIHGPLLFSLEGGDTVLTPGMVEVKDPSAGPLSKIETILTAHRWRCTAYGGAVDGTATPVWCNAEDGTLLSKLLMDGGLVTERCSYSGNQFGTC